MATELSSRAPTPRLPPSTFRRRRSGQTLILGVVTLLVLALVVFITLNVTVSVQQKIAVQNYADARAFSTAVAEARALNYFAYTNRAIASGYVAMANVSAYMSEAAMLADLKMAASTAMGAIATQEYEQCGLTGPQHCYHGFEATLNTTALAIDWITGRMGNKLRKLDRPASDTLDALHSHIQTLHLSQRAVNTNVVAMLRATALGELKQDNMEGAASVTRDEHALGTRNVTQWKQLFFDDATKKKRIMAETVNASRDPFTWNRYSIVGFLPKPGQGQKALFPQDFLGDTVKSSTLWLGPKGDWSITQAPDVGITAGGRSGVTSGVFPLQLSMGSALLSKDAPPATVQGQSISSFDSGLLQGSWRHGKGSGLLPLMNAAGPGEFATGGKNRHRANLGLADVLNRPHQGGQHDKDLGMDRFMEFNVGTAFPYNQPAVYAGANTDSRVNQYGKSGVEAYEVNASGTVHFDTGARQGTLTLSNKKRTRAFSKALVYYHRMGDWSDYPNLFNPYWRAKLQPLTREEALTVVGAVDKASSEVTVGAARASSVGNSAVNIR